MPRTSARLKTTAVTNGTAKPGDPSPSSSPEPELQNKATEKAPAKRKANAEPDKGIKEATKGKITKAAAPAKKRKTQEFDAMPYADRTAISTLKKGMYIGAHVSAAGGVQNAITNALQIGANSFALFLKSQRKWDNPPLTDEVKDLFISACKHHAYDPAAHAVPHGSYLVNLAQPDPTKAAQAYKGFLDDLTRCEALGIKLYNFHPGTTGGEPRDEAIGRIAAQLNKAHKETKSVVTLLENMAGAGNVIGGPWEDLRDIIALVDDKSRVGVCIDTCHAFAAGHDLRTSETFRKVMDSFNSIVGQEYLRAFHVNDSKAPFNSNRDLHANIGTGFLGLRAFHCLMNDASFVNKPMVLETPIDSKDEKGKTVENKQIWADEIKLLESLIGMDPDGKEFTNLEADLQAKGAAERARIQDQVDKKAEKDAKKGTKAPRKKKAPAKSEDESD